MPFYNYYYNPFAYQGIFNIGSVPGRVGVYDLTGYNPYMSSTAPAIRTPVTPNPVANVGESLDAIDARMARGGPSFNSATGKFDNVPDEGIQDGVNQTTQSYGILPWLGVGLYGLNTLGNLFLGWRSLNLARDQFNFQRDLANQNLAASIQAYNDAQRRRLRGLGGFTDEEIDRRMRDREIKDTRKYK